MPKLRKSSLAFVLFASLSATVLGISAFAPQLLDECDICEAATAILLSGTVQGKCTINVSSAAPAADLPIAVAGTHRVMIGTALQDCTGNRSYTISVTSMNCVASPTGAKVVDSVSGEFVRYSGEFVNPVTGGSQPGVTGLLQSNCAGQVGREVTHAKINGETSQVFVNFTGSPDLAAGTYQDIFVLSLNMQ